MSHNFGRKRRRPEIPIPNFTAIREESIEGFQGALNDPQHHDTRRPFLQHPQVDLYSQSVPAIPVSRLTAASSSPRAHSFDEAVNPSGVSNGSGDLASSRTGGGEMQDYQHHFQRRVQSIPNYLHGSNNPAITSQGPIRQQTVGGLSGQYGASVVYDRGNYGTGYQHNAKRPEYQYENGYNTVETDPIPLADDGPDLYSLGAIAGQKTRSLSPPRDDGLTQHTANGFDQDPLGQSSDVRGGANTRLAVTRQIQRKPIAPALSGGQPMVLYGSNAYSQNISPGTGKPMAVGSKAQPTYFTNPDYGSSSANAYQPYKNLTPYSDGVQYLEPSELEPAGIGVNPMESHMADHEAGYPAALDGFGRLSISRDDLPAARSFSVGGYLGEGSLAGPSSNGSMASRRSSTVSGSSGYSDESARSQPPLAQFDSADPASLSPSERSERARRAWQRDVTVWQHQDQKYMAARISLDTQCHGSNWVNLRIVRTLQASFEKLSYSWEFAGFGGRPMTPKFETTLWFSTDGGPSLQAKFFIAPHEDPGFDLLLGAEDCFHLNLVPAAVLPLLPRRLKNAEKKENANNVAVQDGLAEQHERRRKERAEKDKKKKEQEKDSKR